MNNYSNPVTVTGNPASFEASGSGKLLSLSVPFSPIQDLHGYSHPWPAGGGVNKYSILIGADEFGNNADGTHSNDNGTLVVTATTSTSSGVYSRNISTLASTLLAMTGTITYSFDIKANISTTVDVGYEDAGQTKVSVNTSWQRVTITSTAPSSRKLFVVYGTGTAATFYIKDFQLESGSHATAYSPYSNICPISGRTGVSVYRTGKNLLDVESRTIAASQGDSTIRTDNCTATKSGDVLSATITGAWSKLRLHNSAWHFKHGNTYTISAYFDNPSGNKVGICYLKLGASSSQWTTSSIVQTSGKVSMSFTYDDSWGDMVIAFIVNNTNSSTNNSVTVSEMMIELGSTATTYEPYNGNTYTVDWTSAAGTVYGGTLDVVTGVLTVDWASVDMGSLSWSRNATYNVMYAYVAGKANGRENLICSNYKTVELYYEYLSSGEISGALNNNAINVKDDAYTSAADFKTAMSGVQLVYELATPLTYQLTATQIALILGQNNVWSDSNEAVTLTYVIKLFTRYTFIVNGNDYTGLVERDSYRTAVTPVYGETIQTLDGVNHTALLRLRGSITVGLNPQTKANTAAICADLLQSPVEVQYHCLQRNANVTALMVADTISAQFLSRCLANGDDWNKIEEITLTEL